MSYRLFYNYHLLGDILIIIFDNYKINEKILKNDDLYVMYNNNKIVGINICNFSDIIKTKANGIIINPPNEIIDVINHVLENHHLPKLEYQDSSGFIVGRIINIEEIDNKYLYIKIDDGSEYYSIADYVDLQIGQMVIFAKEGTIISNGQQVEKTAYKGYISQVKICSMIDLGISDSTNIYKIDDCSLKLGSDIFKEIK